MTSPEASKTFIISRQISYYQAPVDSELLHGWSKYSVRVTCTPPLTTTCCMDADSTPLGAKTKHYANGVKWVCCVQLNIK